MIWAKDFKLFDFAYEWLVDNVGEVLCAAVWTGCLFLKPPLKARLAEVLSTTVGESRFSQHLGAHIAAEELGRNLVDKLVIIPSKQLLLTWTSHGCTNQLPWGTAST